MQYYRIGTETAFRNVEFIIKNWTADFNYVEKNVTIVEFTVSLGIQWVNSPCIF